MQFWKSREWYVLMALTAATFGFHLYRTATHQNTTSLDFVNYAQFIEPMKLHGTITKPHFIYPMLVAIASLVLPGISYSGLGAGIALVFDCLLATVLWIFWKKILPTSATPIWSILLTLSIMIVAPINLLAPAMAASGLSMTSPFQWLMLFRHSYLGYVAITTYHNPPMMLCKPVALLHFLLFAQAISNGKIAKARTAWCFVTLVLATLMKPNYALIMLPTALLFAAWFFHRKEFRLLRFIALGTVLPALLVLGWQYLFTYASATPTLGESHIIWAPFYVYALRSHYLWEKFLLSILFPLTVLLIYRKEVLRDRFYLTGLLLFIFGAFQAYFLAESGVRLDDGNFFWSAQFGLFFWFLVSMRTVALNWFRYDAVPKWSFASLSIALILALHLVSGAIWYAQEAIRPGAFW